MTNLFPGQTDHLNERVPKVFPHLYRTDVSNNQWHQDSTATLPKVTQFWTTNPRQDAEWPQTSVGITTKEFGHIYPCGFQSTWSKALKIWGKMWGNCWGSMSRWKKVIIQSCIWPGHAGENSWAAFPSTSTSSAITYTCECKKPQPKPQLHNS